jgi:hypothetical protein
MTLLLALTFIAIGCAFTALFCFCALAGVKAPERGNPFRRQTNFTSGSLISQANELRVAEAYRSPEHRDSKHVAGGVRHTGNSFPAAQDRAKVGNAPALGDGASGAALISTTTNRKNAYP